MKLKDTFTPGPWHAHIAPDSLHAPDGVCSVDGLHVCDVVSYGAFPTTRHANALLIAAAPEMAEVMLSILALYKEDPDDLETMDKGIKLMEPVLRKAGLL